MKTDTKRLCDLLYGLNYEVSLSDFTDKHPADISLAQIMSTLLPDVELSDGVRVLANEAISNVQSCIDYIGDDSHGPLKDKIESKEFIALRTDFLEEIIELSAEPSEVFSFYFKSGHPAYPVFWDFAFAFRRPKLTWIVIGSSSD